MSTSAQRLVKNTGIYALGDILPKLFTFIVFPVFTKNLPPEEYGIINYVTTIETFLAVLCVLCLNTYFLVYFFKVKGEEEKKKLYSNISFFIIGFSLLFSILLHLVGPAFFRLWGSNVDFYPYISLCIIGNLFNVVTFLPTCLYRVQENPLPLTILNVVKSFFIMGASIVAVLVINGGAYEVMLCRVSVGVLFSFLFIFSTRKFFTKYFNLKEIKGALKFALPLVPGALAYYLYSLFDRVLIDKYLSLKELGIYTTATTLAMILNIVSNGAYKAFEPYFFQNFTRPDFSKKFKQVRDVLLFVVLMGALFISVFAKEFFTIFASEAYSEAYRYVPIVIIGVVSSSMSLMYSTVIIAKEKTFSNTLITIMGCCVSIVLNVIFLRSYGLASAAIVSMSSFTIVLLANMLVSKVPVPHARAVVASGIVIVVSFMLAYGLKEISLYSITIKVVVSLITIAATLGVLQINAVSSIKRLLTREV